MNSQDYRNLQEAYLDVYEQEEALDEGKSSRPRYPGGRGVLDQETRDEKRGRRYSLVYVSTLYCS